MFPETVQVVPMRQLSYRMEEIAGIQSTLGAEAAAAEHLIAVLCVTIRA